MKTFLAIAILVLVISSSAASGSLASTERVSVSSAGAQGDRDSFAVGLSADARFVLVNSQATNLVPGDTNDRWDVFVFDRSTGAMQRVSVTNGGAQARPGSDPFGGSLAGGISANGRFVVFRSDAANLAAHDTNRVSDVFVYDRAGHRVTRVTVSSKGRQANGPSGDPAISANGRYVAFSSVATNLVPGDTNGLSDVFVRDLRTHRTIRVSVTSRGRQALCKAGGCESTEPALNANGRYVAFESSATNLVAGDTNRLADVFVHDLRSGRTERVSVSSAGRQAGGDRTNNGSNAPAISADGRYVAFHSYALEPRPGRHEQGSRHLRTRPQGRKTARVSVSGGGRQAEQESLGSSAISADGRYVASPPSPRTSSRATSTGSRTSSSATCAPARRSSSASAPQGTRATTRAPRAASSSARTIATWPSRPGPGTSSRATRTTSRTRSCAISRPAVTPKVPRRPGWMSPGVVAGSANLEGEAGRVDVGRNGTQAGPGPDADEARERAAGTRHRPRPDRNPAAVRVALEAVLPQPATGTHLSPQLRRRARAATPARAGAGTRRRTASSFRPR